MKTAVYKSDFELTKGTPCLILKGDLWGVYFQDLREYSLHDNVALQTSPLVQVCFLTENTLAYMY